MNSTAASCELGIGVRILDCDHREMAETFDELRTGLVRDENQSRTFALLRKLTKFTLLHFALEEGMMAATKYSEIAAHRLSHQHMADRIKALVFHFSRNSAAVNQQALELLTESNAAHIEHDDLEYGCWLNGNGKG